VYASELVGVNTENGATAEVTAIVYGETTVIDGRH
jgi:hypothetical protein